LLVVSSDRANLALMMQLLSKRGDLSVQSATKGTDGVKLAVGVPPAVVVLDTELSDTCARAVLKTLNENPLTSKIPVIAVSANAQESQIEAGLKAGFYRYLTKPYKLSDLLDAIDDSLGCHLGIEAAT
jgi:CheY-like chemotaxis protein